MYEILQEYGDLVRWRGFGDMYFVNHPDFIRPVLTQDYRHFSKDVLQNRILSQMAGKGLVTNDGPDWVRQRRLIQPLFAKRELARFDDGINALTMSTLDEWDRRDTATTPLMLDRELSTLTFGILGETLFGTDVRAHEDEIAEIRDILNLKLYDMQAFQTLNPGSDTSFKRNLEDALKRLDRIVFSLIGARRRNTNASGGLLELLAAARDERSGEGMDDRQMRDEIVTLMFAGHETTAMGIAWTLYLLATHPEIAERLREHLETHLHGGPAGTGDLARLPYLKQVIQEGLRLYPPIWQYARRAERETELDEFVLPARAWVGVATYALHRHPEFWPEPEHFDPDRFHPDREWEFFAWLPFGAGPRVCAGASMAMQEIQLIVAQIVQRFRIHVVPDHPIETEALVTLKPRHGIPVTLSRR